ncbi:MAG: hypothetical protein AAGJ81_09400 [Verrucomicrobiota bacterium]
MTFKKTAAWVLVITLLLVAVISYPAYREIRDWRASGMAEEAESMLASPETLNRAWELAHAARSLSPSDPAIARVLARVYSATDPVAAYPFWEEVVDLSDNHPDDRLELAKAYLHANLWPEFKRELENQRELNLNPNQLDYLETLAATLQGDYELALSRANDLVEKRNAAGEADTLFFQLTRLSSDPAIRRSGIDHLWRIASDEGPRSDEALKTLSQLPDLQQIDLEALIETIEQRENNSRDMQLLAKELLLRLPETDRDAVFNQIQSLFPSNELSDSATLGRWLNRNGLYAYTPRVIPLETAMKRQDLFLILLDAMALNQEWEAIRGILEGPRVPVEDYLSSSFRMRTFIETGDDRRARLAWEQALSSAARESPKLYYLAQTASQLELPEYEEAALRRTIESPDLRKRAFTDLLALLQRQGETTKLQAALVEYTQFFPRDQSAKNDALYLGFLTETPQPSSLAEAQKLFESQPNILAYRMTVLLGLLHQGRPMEAVSLLDGLPVNWFEVRDRWRLLAALALHRTGFEPDAQKLASQTNPSNLLPEEQLFLQEIFSEK